MYSYCTLFDSSYLTRGLAMYKSLQKYSEDFNLYIFAFDDISCDILRGLNLEFATIISLEEFEDKELLKIKNDRSAREYCWTCTPSTIKFCIEVYNLDSCTYLDADMCFFSNPSVLIEEMGGKSVLITEHRYTHNLEQVEKSGKYCVQFITFKNNIQGMKVLNWWRDSCNNWCYARFEDGKFGDQKYLDDWMNRFTGIHELQHLGGGMAPWNIEQYKLFVDNDQLKAMERKTGSIFNVVFYHYHNLKFIDNNSIDLTDSKLSYDDINLIYRPYIKEIMDIDNHLKGTGEEGDFNATTKHYSMKPTHILRVLKRKMLRRYNVYSKKYFMES
jgi:hypothetical protein